MHHPLTFLLADMDDRPGPDGAGRGPALPADADRAFEAALAGTSGERLPAELRPGVRAAAFRVASEAVLVALRLAPARCALHRGDAHTDGRSYAGEGVDAAHALHAEAAADQVLVSAGAAAALVSGALPAGASLTYRGVRPLDGRRRTRVYELRSSAGHHPLDDAGAANLGWAQRSAPDTVVGRDDVLDHLLDAWREAAEGKARLVVLAGDAGIGKTTVVSELALRAHAEGAQVLYGRWDEDRIADYQGVRSALGAYARRAPTRLIRRDLTGHVEQVARLLPDVGARLGGARAPLTTDPEAERSRLFEAVEAWLGRIASRRPLLLVLDDLHWAERASVALLTSVLDAGPSSLLVVGTVRAPGGEVPAGPLADLPPADWVRLGGLSEEAVGDLVAGRLGRPVRTEESASVRRLCVETAGNPLFVNELLQGLGDDPAAALGAVSERLPEQVHDAVRWRLDRLPAPVVDALGVASVVGEEFAADVLADVLGRPPDALGGELAAALRAGIVREVRAEPALRLAFSHGVVRRALQDALDPRDVADLHAAIGDALARRIDDGATVAEVAHHHLQSGRDAEAAVGWARRAAAQARREAAFESAVDLLERAVEADDRHGDDPALACELRIELAEAHDRAGEYTRRDQRHLEAAEFADTLGRTSLFVRAALGYGGRLPSWPLPNPTARRLLTRALAHLPEDDSRRRALALARLATISHVDSPFAARRSLADEAVEMARRLNNPVVLAQALVHRWIALEGPDHVDEALDTGLEVMRIGRRTADPDVELEGIRMRLHSLFTIGAIEAAAELGDRFVDMAERSLHPEFLRLAVMWRTMWAALDGRWGEVDDAVAQLAVRLRASGHPQADIIPFGQQLPGRWMRGRLEEGREFVDGMRFLVPEMPISQGIGVLLDTATGRGDAVRAAVADGSLPELASVEQGYMWLPTATTYALAAAELGEADWADRIADALRPYADRHCVVGYAFYGGHAGHHLGALAAAAGRPAEAVDHLRRGLDGHRALGARPWVALSARWLANALVASGAGAEAGGAAEARALHAEADELAAALGLTVLPDPAAPTG